jgi:hypothetical protein
VVTVVNAAAEFGTHSAGTVISYAEQAGSRVYHLLMSSSVTALSG